MDPNELPISERPTMTSMPDVYEDVDEAPTCRTLPALEDE